MIFKKKIAIPVPYAITSSKWMKIQSEKEDTKLANSYFRKKKCKTDKKI